AAGRLDAQRTRSLFGQQHRGVRGAEVGAEFNQVDAVERLTHRGSLPRTLGRNVRRGAYRSGRELKFSRASAGVQVHGRDVRHADLRVTVRWRLVDFPRLRNSIAHNSDVTGA